MTVQDPQPDPPPARSAAAAVTSPLAERLSQRTSAAAPLPLGIIGCVISSVGACLTCGILAPLGLVVSIIGLREQPRKYAIIGVILGVLGSFIPGILLFAAYATFALDDETDGGVGALMAQAPLRRAEQMIENARDEAGNLPSVDGGQSAIQHLQDRWGNRMVYVPLEEGNADGDYAIVSAGPDAEFGTDDDVVLMSSADQQD